MKSNNEMFYNELFAYYEDNILGLKLWNAGYKVASYPFISSRHQGSTSFKRIRKFQIYLIWRNRAFLNAISNSRYKNLIRTLFLKSIFLYHISKITHQKSFKYEKEFLQLLMMAYKNGEKMSKIIKENINLYNAPILKINPNKALPMVIIPRRHMETLIKKDVEKMLLTLL